MILNTLWNFWTATEVKIGFVFGFILSLFLRFIGGWDAQIAALCTLVFLDFASGSICAFKTHNFVSSIATKGMIKKGVMFLIIMLGVLLDSALNTVTVRGMFISSFSIIEALSLVENIDKMGYGQYIPDFLRKWLAQIETEKLGNVTPHVPQPTKIDINNSINVNTRGGDRDDAK